MTSQREDFTSEVFKIEITNIVVFGFGELKTFLKKKMQLVPVKMKVPPGRRDIAYLCFRSEDERLDALKKLNGYKWKGREIKATLAKAVADPMEQKRERADGPVRTILEATAPLAQMPYDKQLALKEAELLDILKSYGNQVNRLNSSLNIRAKMDSNEGIPCKWLGMKASPIIDGYRNKSEFTVGKNANGEKVVGFRLSSYVDGSVEVDSSLENLPHISASMRKAAALFQMYIRQSPHNVFCPEMYTGVFRQLTVRVSQATNDIMIVIGIHSKPIEDVAGLKKDILSFFTEREGKELEVASIYMEHMNKREPGQLSNVVDHIFGVTHITDVIHGLRFRISPESFFQVNTLAAEVLYQSAIDLGAPTDETILLDICCGTGTIGLCFSKFCKQVLGVEIIPTAIKDAEYNTSINDISNCKFFAGNCDDYIRKFVHENPSKDLLAIIDPPRAGLHVKSIASLRNSKGLNRFVYISCSPKAALRNWLDLARPSSKAYKGEPFVMTTAVGVDMFPHTNHKEMVLLFERVTHDDSAPVVVEAVAETDDITEILTNITPESVDNRNNDESEDSVVKRVLAPFLN